MNKVYQSGDYVAVHKNPVWRDKANFIIKTYLGQKYGRNEWEQLWALDLGDRQFALCCIPFFAYDLALGDEVETDGNYVVQRVIKTSDQYTFRVWFGDSTHIGIKDEVSQQMKARSAELEWSSENLLALSVSAEQAQQVANYLYAEQNARNLVYETGLTLNKGGVETGSGNRPPESE